MIYYLKKNLLWTNYLNYLIKKFKLYESEDNLIDVDDLKFFNFYLI